MVIRDEFEVTGISKITPIKTSLPTAQNKYDALFGYNRDTNTISPNASLLKTTNKYDSLFGYNRPSASPSITALPESNVFTPAKTSGTFGEVAKAWTGSAGAGILNLVSSAVGTMERQAVAGTDAEGIGFVGMWDNIVKAFSPQATEQERYKVAADIFRTVTNIMKPGQIRTDKNINTIEDVMDLEGGSVLETKVKKGEDVVRKWADVENESDVVKFLSGIGESIPTSYLPRLLGPIGWFLMGNNVYRNTIAQTRAEYAARGEVVPENLLTAKAMGYTAFELIIEQLTGIAAPVKAAIGKTAFGNATKGLLDMFFKKTGKKAVESTAKTVWKYIGKQIGGEGLEEVLTDLGQALVAKLTTNKDDPYFTVRDEDGGLTSFKSLGLSALAGALMASPSAGYQGAKYATKNRFYKTQEAIKDVENDKVGEIPNSSVDNIINTLNLEYDANENGEQDFVAQGMLQTIAKYAVTQGQTFKTNTGKLFTIPSNQTVDSSKASPEAFRDVIAMKERKLQSTQMPLEVPTTASMPISDVTPIATQNVSTGRVGGVNVRSEQSKMTLGEYEVDTEKFSTPNGVLEIIKDSPYAPEKYNSVYNFQVDDNSQKRGEGTALINEALKKYGDKLSAQTSSKNSTKFFYNRGFRPRKNINATLEESLEMFAEAESLAMIYNADVIKTSQQQPTAQTQNKSALVAESQKQDISGTQGIVAPGFTIQAQANEPAWKRTISQETRQAIDVASKPNANQSWFNSFKEKLGKFREYTTLGSVPIDVAKADIRRLFREARSSSQYAKGQAENIIAKSYNKAGKDKYDLLRHSIIYLDIAEDIRGGLYDSGSAMMFDIKSPEEALNTIYAIKEELKKPENQLVREALATRKQLMDEVRDEVIAEGTKANVDLRHIKSKTNYMYHAVTEFRDEFNAALKAKGTRRGVGRVEYMARTGSLRDYISDPMMADYLVLQKMIRDLSRLKLFNEIKTEDISKTLSYTPDKDWVIKPGYSELDPGMLGIVEFDKYSKQQARAIATANLQSRNIDPHSDAGKRALSKIMTRYNNHVLVVPTQIVDAVVNEFANKETTTGKAFKRLMNIWKYTKIKMPNAVWKYNTRNLFGDLDPIVMAKPNALLKIPRALKELYAFFYKGGVLTQDLQDYIKRGGITTGQTPQELKTFNTSKLINVYEQSIKTADVAKRSIRKIWSALTLETATQYREQVLRYSAYLAYNTELAKSKTGLPKYYAASIPAEIQGLKEIKDRSYKLANDLVGAYDDVSLFGQWASDHLMPFFRFKEINIKRNYRMIKNAFYNDGVTIQNSNKQAINKLGNIAKASVFSVFRLSKLMLGTAAFYGALALANGLSAPEDEDDLPEDVKNSPHITIPRWLTGGDKVYYIDRLGSFAELLNVFGIDYSLGSDLNDIATGRMKAGDKLREIAMSPISDVFNSSWPMAKIAFELVTGKTYFPDPQKPATIRDIWEYLFGQVGFKDEYKWIAGKPIDSGNILLQKRNILFNSVMPGDAAFYDVYDMVDDYFKSKGDSSTFTNYMDKNTDKYRKSQAVYYYKTALKLGDAKAAEKYLAEYVTYGGTQKTLKESMDYLNPLNSMTVKKKAEFLAWITPEEKETYDRAMAYYKELLDISSDIAFPKAK